VIHSPKGVHAQGLGQDWTEVTVRGRTLEGPRQFVEETPVFDPKFSLVNVGMPLTG